MLVNILQLVQDYRFFKRFIFNLDIPGNPEIYATKPDYAKQAEYAVLTLIFLSIKYNLDSRNLRCILEEHKIASLAIDELIKVYENNKTSLRIKNLTTGHSLSHLTNVEWKLTCDIKSSQIDASSGELNYSISLGRFKQNTGESESIADFACNVEELQALVNKLKDIERHCEKLADTK